MFLRRLYSVGSRPLTDPLNIVRPSAGSASAAAAGPVSSAVHGARLESGVRVVSAASALPVTSVCVRVEAGSRYETAASAGTAHAFASNLVYAASSKRSALQVARALENELPGGFSAAATRDAVVLTGHLTGQHDADAILPLLRELLSPKLAEWELVRARARVARAAEACHQADGAARAVDECYGAAYRRDGLGRSLVSANSVGQLLNVDSGGVNAVRQFLGSRFVAPNVTVAVVGAAGDHDQLASTVGSVFGDLPADGSGPGTGASAYVGGGSSLVEAPGPATHVAVAWNAAGVSVAEARVVAALLGHPAAADTGILGCGGSNRYVDAASNSLAGRNLAAAAPRSFDCQLAVHGQPGEQLLLVRAELAGSAAAIRDSLQALVTECASTGAASEAAVGRAKLLATGRLLRQAESVNGSVRQLADQAAVDPATVQSVVQQADAVNAVTPAQVAKALKTIMSSGASLGAYGPEVAGVYI